MILLPWLVEQFCYAGVLLRDCVIWSLALVGWTYLRDAEQGRIWVLELRE